MIKKAVNLCPYQLCINTCLSVEAGIIPQRITRARTTPLKLVKESPSRIRQPLGACCCCCRRLPRLLGGRPQHRLVHPIDGASRVIM